ncbi:MAG: class I SAM-dependent methyltransferase [SAR324 cluster bacterium]|nr:class I SAM-dependent methyltransferase [SAR324 cluster bacterium]
MTGLDAGCGEGRHAFEALRRGARIVAMDVQRRDLARTRFLLASVAREGGSLPNGTAGESGAAHALTLQGNAQRLPFPGECFDRVICSEVLEHVQNPMAAARELARVLRPGGHLAVSVPTPMTEWAFRFASDDYFNTPGGHVRIFTPRRLVRLMARAGLEVRDIHFEHAFHSLYWLCRAVFGLHDEGHPAIRHFRKVLTYVLFSPSLSRAERLFNRLLPKAMVLYFGKGEARPHTQRG